MAAGTHWTRARIRAARMIADGVRELEVEPLDGPAERHPAGAHLELAVVLGGVPDTRSYSLVGEGPVAGAYRIAVKRLADSRGGSALMHAIEPGVELDVSAPISDFELQWGRAAYLLLAGGIGITPLVGMAQALVRRDAAEVRLVHAVRERAEAAYAADLAAALGDRYELRVSGEGERLDLAAEIAALHPEGELYLCGPGRMRDAARAAWAQAGRPAAALRFETFGSGGAFAATEFTVQVREYGDRAVTIPPDRTLLAALEAAGVPVMSDCLRGECGLCVVSVLDRDGDLDHRDVFLSDEQREAGDRLCACVSRARGTLTIDTGFRPR